MPGPNQTLIPFTPTNYTSQTASVYKGNLDGNCLLANVAGMNCVYPGTGLQVLVDTAFIICKNGTGVIDQRAGSPAAVALVAPGSNSYWATIFLNTQTNVVGVIYGTAAVTPAPILPNSIRLIPLAFVLIANGQTTIAASNILDARGALFPDDSPIVFNASGSSLVANTFGASTTDVSINLTANFALNFTQVRYGSTAYVDVVNTSGSSFNFQMNFTLADGVTTPTIFGYLIGGSSYSRFVFSTVTISLTIATGSRYVFNCFASEANGSVLVQGMF
jgi:hypothetical protein